MTDTQALAGETSAVERHAMRTLAADGYRLAATEHGVTFVGPARHDVSQAAEDAVDALTALGWTETPIPGDGLTLASPGPLRDVLDAQRVTVTLALEWVPGAAARLWALVEQAEASHRAALAAMRRAYRARQLARRRRNRR